jgi:predicted esterase
MNPIFPLLLLLCGRLQDGADLWKAIDGKSVDRVKEVCGDPAKLVEAIRRGRPLAEAVTGETKERLTDAFGRETDLWIIVPKSYDRTKPAGVFLALHGLGGTGAQLKDLWAAYAAEHNFIIAAPSAQKEPPDLKNEDTGGRELKHWWCYREGGFPLSALSVLKKRYAIDENSVILTGYSMGGFGTWNIGLRYPDRFCALIPYAGGLSRAEYAGLKVDERMRKLHLNSFNLPVCFIHGDADKTVPVEFDRESDKQLKALGYEHEYKEVAKGGHIMNVREGGEIMAGIQKWVEGRVRKPHPREVKHHAIGDYCPRSYWVRLEGFKDKSAEVRASINGQAIDFTATGADKVTFYIDETLLDLSKPVKVTSGGATLFEGEVKPSMEVVLETWWAREDRDLLYRAKITVDTR